MQISLQKILPRSWRNANKAKNMVYEDINQKTLNLKNNPGSLFGNRTNNSLALNVYFSFILSLLGISLVFLVLELSLVFLLFLVCFCPICNNTNKIQQNKRLAGSNRRDQAI